MHYRQGSIALKDGAKAALSLQELTRAPAYKGPGPAHASQERAYAKGMRCAAKGLGWTQDTYKDPGCSKAFREGYAEGVRVGMEAV